MQRNQNCIADALICYWTISCCAINPSFLHNKDAIVALCINWSCIYFQACRLSCLQDNLVKRCGCVDTLSLDVGVARCSIMNRTQGIQSPLWRHGMESLRITGPLPGESTGQLYISLTKGQVMWNFGVFVCFLEQIWWFETPWRSCDDTRLLMFCRV